MSERLPDPMPENLADRKAIEALLGDMEAGEIAEEERIQTELHNGRSAGDILEELGPEATVVIGEENVKDLKEEAQQEDLERKLLTDKEK